MRLFVVMPVGVLVFQFFLISGCDSRRSIMAEERREYGEIMVPDTYNSIPAINDDLPQRIRDLLSVVYALDRFDRDHYRFPESSRNGYGWDGFFTKNGRIKENWVDGLVPSYIDYLPRDPDLNKLSYPQYLYRSNGVDYKLIVYEPPDCELVKARYPELIDLKRGCGAYGFWTEGAVNW